MESIWTFIQTLGNGIVQGFNQFVANDLKSYVPLFIFAGVLIVISQIWKIIRKYIKK